MKADRHSIIKVSLILILTAYLCYLYSADYAKDIPIEKIAEAMEKEPSVTSLRKQGRTELRRFYQIDEKEKNNQIMIRILSQIVEFRKGESGLHVEHINILTGLLLERLVQKTDHYDLAWSDQYRITLASPR